MRKAPSKTVNKQQKRKTPSKKGKEGFCAFSFLRTTKEAADSKMHRKAAATGLCGRVRYEQDQPVTMGGLQVPDVGNEGHDGWIYTLKHNKARTGPHVSPIPCVGSFHSPVTHVAFFVLLPVEQLISLGIAIPAFTAHLGTREGETFLLKYGRIARVPPGATMWVPFGWISQPVFFDFNKKEKHIWAHTYHLPVFEPGFKAQVGASVVQAVKSYSEKYLLSEAATLESFKVRAKVFLDYLNEMLDIPAANAAAAGALVDEP